MNMNSDEIDREVDEIIEQMKHRISVCINKKEKSIGNIFLSTIKM